MSKFKVGDRVLVKKPVEKYMGPAWVERMDCLDSTVVEVEAPFSEHGGMMCFSSGEWIIADDWAEIVSPSADLTILTRRDHFAMAALTGYLSGIAFDKGKSAQDVAEDCYWFASAMEAARNKEGAE